MSGTTTAAATTSRPEGVSSCFCELVTGINSAIYDVTHVYTYMYLRMEAVLAC